MAKQDGEGSKTLHPANPRTPNTGGAGDDIVGATQVSTTGEKAKRMSLVGAESDKIAGLEEGSSSISNEMREKKVRRNAVTEAKAGLTNYRIKHLAEIFEEADVNGLGYLNMEQFRNVLRKVLPHPIPESEMDLIFMKTDVNYDGTIDWDEYLSFILLECKGKDKMAVMEQQCFQRSPKFIKADKSHKDSVVSLLFQRLTSKKETSSFSARYISISRDGAAIFWNSTFQPSCSHRIESSKTVWVTDTCIMPNVNLIAVATTARAVSFYDITGNRFVELSRIIALESCPTAIYYWHSPVDAECSVLVLGDDHGGVTLIVFKACPLSTDINPKRISNKGQVDRIHIGSIIRGNVASVRACWLENVHLDLVKQVMYLPHLGCFVSCCKDASTALCMATVDLDLQRKVVPTYFRVTQGLNTFDYCKHLNMIVTGGYDALIRVWNPYISSRPSSMLYGHQSPILFVRVNSKKELVISVSEIKEVRIHDLNSQTCVQKFYKKMFPELEPRPISACLFVPVREDLVVATTEIAILEGRENEMRDPESMSHLTPVTRVLYNPLFHVVVSASWDALVCVWDLATGVKQLQFKAYKVKNATFDREITAMTFDPTYRRLITSGQKGNLRIWNFNNGELLYEMPNVDMMEISCIIWNKQRIITGGWSQRVAIYLETKDNYMLHLMRPSHKGDVTSLACYRGSLVASACFDGDIYIWYMETGRLLSVINASVTTDRPLSAKEFTGQHAPNPSIYYANTLKKNPHLTADLVPLPSYLKKAPSIDIGQALKGEGDSSVSEVVDCNNNHEKSRENHREKSNNTQQEFRHKKPGGRKERSKAATNKGIEKMVFLEDRENTQDNAILLCADTSGIISAWSLHPRGGLKARFHASSDCKEPVTAMTYVRQLKLLLTGDSRGYIRVWDINHFAAGDKKCSSECLERWSHFTFVRWKLLMRRRGIYRGLFSHRASENPHLITSFRGHVSSVTSFDVFLAVSGEELMFSSGLDCSVRIWRLSGECLGIYNQSHYWNIKSMELPVWRDETYTTEDGDTPESLSIKRRRKILVPRDIQRVASATTIHVLFAERQDLWSKVRKVIKLLVAYRRRSRAPSRAITKESVECFGRIFEPLRECEEDELDIKSLLIEAERKKATVEPNPILGMSYRKSVNHRPLPTLTRPPALEPQCSAYRALPYYDLSLETNPMAFQELRTIRKVHKLPPISQSRFNRFCTVGQRANEDVRIANLAMSLTQGRKRKLSTQVITAGNAEATEKGATTRRAKKALMGAVALLGLHRKLHYEALESDADPATDDSVSASATSSATEVELSRNPSVTSEADTVKGSPSMDSVNSAQELNVPKPRKRSVATPKVKVAMPVLEELGEA